MNNNWYKDEHSPFGVTASGYTIDQICVKGGQNMITYNSNGSDGCWSVSGIGTQTASAVKVGQGSTCKDISHASFHRIVVPTVTPTLTLTPTLTPTVTPVPTNIPSVVPSTSPTLTKTPTSNEDPSITPSATPTITVTPTPTNTPQGGTSDSSTSSNSSSSTTQAILSTSTEVAGVSTLASTGGIIESLMNSVFISGLLTFAFGLKRHGKKN